MAIGGILGGAGIGALLGSVGGTVQGVMQAKQAKRDRRNFRKGMDQGIARTNRQVFDILQGPEYQAARSFALGTFGINQPMGGAGGDLSFGGQTFEERPTGFALSGHVRKGARFVGKKLGIALNAQQQLDTGLDLRGRALSAGMRARLQAQVDAAPGALSQFDTQSAEFRQMALTSLGEQGYGRDALSRFRPQTGGPVEVEGGQAQAGNVPGFGLNSPLAQDFAKALQQASSVRGAFFGNAPAAGEAGALAAFNFQQQRELLPFLLGLNTYGEDQFSRFSQQNIAQAVQRRSGGAAVYGAANPFGDFNPQVQGISAGTAGFGAGAAIGAQASGGSE